MLTTVKENESRYSEKNTDYDGLWKNLIEELFREFMQYFAPDLYPEIDFEKGATFINPELHQLFIENKKGRKYADKLVQVSLRNGEEKYIFVHIEIQAIGKEEFAKRMFQYFYRMFDKYNHKIYAIALLTDPRHENHTNKFEYSFYGTTLTYAYNTYQFHEQKIEDLTQSSNPFSLAVLAGIYTSKAAVKRGKEYQKRFNFKQKLISLALEKYAHHGTYLSALLYFIDYILQIPPELQEKLHDALPLEIKKKGAKIMGMERLRDTPTFGRVFREIEEEATKKGLEKGMAEGMEKGIEKGMEKGKEKGKKEAEKRFAKKLLQKDYSDEEISQLTDLELEEVKKMRDSLGQ